MNLKEVWTGTPEEIGACRIVGSLKKKANDGQKLSSRNSRQLEIALPISRRINRRRFLIISGGVAAAGAAAAAFNSLGRDSDAAGKVQTESTPIPTRALEVAKDWQALPAKERLQILYSKGDAHLEGLAAINEVISASAEFYTQNTPPKHSAQELRDRTHLVSNTQEFVDIMSQHGNLHEMEGSTRSEVEARVERQSTAATTQDTKEVYLNMAAINTALGEGLKMRPDLQKSGELNKVISYNVLHEYGHVNQSSRLVTLPELLTIYFDDGSCTIKGLNGINIDATLIAGDGIDDSGITSEEALIDTQAFKLCELAGNDITRALTNRYDQGRLWVKQINNNVGITDAELSKYITGDLPLEDMLRRWGYIGRVATETNDVTLTRGLIVLTAIGLQTEDRIDTDTAYNAIVSQIPLQ